VTQLDTVRRVRTVLRIPLTVGGGIRSVADARRLLAAGADKISVNTAAVRRPALLSELAAEFGRQCVVLAIDARRIAPGWEVLVLGGREVARPDAVAWAREGEQLGAGEILLTSWDQDGTRAGPDVALLRAVADAVRVPSVAARAESVAGRTSPPHSTRAPMRCSRRPSSMTTKRPWTASRRISRSADSGG
jgi:imidazoleglycerol phosphate synthase cyclase subunit